MPVSRIKSIIIGVLVIINLLFLAYIVIDHTAESRARAEELQRITELYTKNGVFLSPDLKLSDTPAGRSWPRSIQAEEEIARRLLGETSVSDQGGSIYLYTSELGTALFRSGGEFEIGLEPGAYPAECTEAAVKRLVQELGLTAETAVITGDTARTVQTVQEIPIFNCVLELSFQEGSLIRMSGRLAASGGTPAGGGGMTCASALMRFLSLVLSGDVACTHVYDIFPGYVMNTSVFGTVELQPAWKLVTDTGEYRISAVSGVQLT